MAHPYRDSAIKPESPPKRNYLAKAAKVFAIAGSIWVGYECISRARELDSRLRSDSSYLQAQAYERAGREIGDARSALVHTPGITAIICGSENMCLPIITEDTYPDTARARRILSSAERDVGPGEISQRMARIRESLPQNPSTGADVDLCNRLSKDLESVESSVSEARSRSLGTDRAETEKMKQMFELASVVSIVSMLLLVFSLKERNADQTPPDPR